MRLCYRNAPGAGDGGGHALRALRETGSAAAAIATAAQTSTASQQTSAAGNGWVWLEGKEALFLGLSIGLLALIIFAFVACWRCSRVRPAPELQPSLPPNEPAAVKGEEPLIEWPVVVVEPDRTLSVGYEVKLDCGLSDEEDEQEASVNSSARGASPPSTEAPSSTAATPAPGTLAAPASSPNANAGSSSQAGAATSHRRHSWMSSLLGWRS